MRGDKGVETVELAPGLLLMCAPDWGRIPYAHSLLALGKKSILIDTGLGPEALQRLRKRFSVSLVLNSHYHRDHNWGNHLFRDVPVRAHRLDAPMLNSMRAYFRAMGIVGRRDEALVRRFTLSFIPHIKGPRVGVFESGEVFDTGELELEAIHLPGHSPGHCGFLHRPSCTLFSADIAPDPFGPWYGHACSSMEDFAASIDKIVALGPRALVPSHGRPIRRGIRRVLRRYKSRISWRDGRLLKLLSRPLTLPEIIARHPFYMRRPRAMKLPYSFWEEMMVTKHLERLLAEGLVVKAGRRFRSRPQVS
ncbi:MAG: MBL fold metallo-hydrolase [Thermoplasmatota archaeon]